MLCLASFRPLIAAVVAAMAILVFATPAVAEDEPTRKELERAAVHYDRGVEHYAAANYSKAIVEFLKAHHVVPNALFLYNVSLSYWKLDNFPEALNAARKVRAHEGLGEKRQLRNEAHIRAWERILAAQDVAEDKRLLTRQKAEEREEEKVEEAVGAGKSRGSFGALGWIGVGVGVVGGGLTAGAVAIDASIQDDIEAYEAAAASGDEAEYQRLKGDISDRQKLGRVLLYSGAGLAATGLMMVIIDAANGPNEAPSERAWIPAVTPTENGAAFGLKTRW